MRGQARETLPLLAWERRHLAGSDSPIGMNNRESIDEGLHPTRKQTPHEVRAVGGPHPGKAKEHDAAVRPGLDDHELAEVLVIRQQHTTAGDRTFENIRSRVTTAPIMFSSARITRRAEPRPGAPYARTQLRRPAQPGGLLG